MLTGAIQSSLRENQKVQGQRRLKKNRKIGVLGQTINVENCPGEGKWYKTCNNNNNNNNIWIWLQINLEIPI